MRKSNNKKRICLFGAGGHGRVVAAQLKADGHRYVFFGDHNHVLGDRIDGIPIKCNRILDLDPEEWLLITIGDNQIRKNQTSTALASGCKLTKFVSADARVIGDIEIGMGTQILAGTIVNTGAKIGDGVIINSGAVIEHDCIIEDYCHISPNSTIAGSAVIQEGTWVGAGATVLPEVEIPKHTIIGAGAVVTKTILESGTYVGVPARKLIPASRKNEDKYA